MTETEIRQTWRRIDRWLLANVPELAPALREPATAARLAEAERELGVSFESEFRASLAVHDGQDPAYFEVFGDWALLALENVVATWRSFAQMAARGTFTTVDDPSVRTKGAVRPRAWDAAWVPIASSGGGDHLLLDLDPADGGDRGQVITHPRLATSHEVLAPGIGAWLARVADDLESGRFEAVGPDQLERRR